MATSEELIKQLLEEAEYVVDVSSEEGEKEIEMKQMDRRATTGMPATSSAYFAGPSNRYQSTECILYGSVLNHRKISCCRGCVSMSSRCHFVPRAQHVLQTEDGFLYWHCRYIGIPEADLKSPVTVRKTLDSMIFSTDMMVFVKTLGLRMEYEFIADGWLFTTATKENIRILVYKVEHTEEIGNYSKSNLKPLTESYLVEATVVLPDGQPHDMAAKALREFATNCCHSAN
uniref:Mediator of RNA polymerase II transcription subunit 18 n=1 Tax=Ditylenchus dipsaci TaxID=166011 RepID=A0A915ENK4_9BILA